MAGAQTSVEGRSVPSDQPKRRLPMLSKYLDEQQQVTAIERFSQHHDDVEHPLQERYYRALLPATPPQPGQQYAFEVDIDRCSGCKACVTACHSLNGLDEHETWRSVGLLHGGTSQQPIQKTVTTACHHCVDPGCMKGCPVGAYEKHPETGIVKHLDDQCIGCQYCIFTCPYEVPQFNAKLGIVRKCDMCSDRLEDGEAPACVQACPNEAIAIRTVAIAEAIESAQNDTFLPCAPSPGTTIPTTTYTSKDPMPSNMLPADFFRVHASHAHLPLVVLLVLSQLSVGAFGMSLVLPRLLGDPTWSMLAPYHATTALGLGLLALVASTTHLGRPRYAYRAVLGLRTSWMSREIVAFGSFLGAATMYTIAEVLSHVPGWLPELAMPFARQLGLWQRLLAWATVGTGLLGVLSSVMLYAVTGRQWWAFPRTAFRFFMTAIVTGLATSITVLLFIFSTSPRLVATTVHVLALALLITTILKLAGEASVFAHLRDRQQGDLKRSALLLRGELAGPTVLRFAFGMFGGIAIPGLVFTSIDGLQASVLITLGLVSTTSLVAGELLERMNFFGALSSPRMPGGLD